MYATAFAKYVSDHRSTKGEKRWFIYANSFRTQEEALEATFNLSRPFAVAVHTQTTTWWPMELLPEELSIVSMVGLSRALAAPPADFLPLMGYLRLPDKVKTLPLDVIAYLFRGEDDDP